MIMTTSKVPTYTIRLGISKKNKKTLHDRLKHTLRLHKTTQIIMLQILASHHTITKKKKDSYSLTLSLSHRPPDSKPREMKPRNQRKKKERKKIEKKNYIIHFTITA